MGWIIEIITQLIEIKKSKNIYMAVIKKIAKKNPKIASFLKKSKSLYADIHNPKSWFNILKNSTKDEIETIAKVKKTVEKWTETKSYYKLDKPGYNSKNLELDNEMNGKSEWVNLSSSWLQAGIWEITSRNKVMGSLTIKIKNYPKIYTYPIVPYQVWVAMKNAKGSNGSGAGSAFWKFWLHDWLPSTLRQKVLNDLKKNEITSKDAIEVFKQQTHKSALQFFKSNGKKNTFGNLNKIWYQSYGGKGYRTKKIAEFKKYNYYNSRYITYKNVRKTKSYINIEPIKVKVKKPTAYGQILRDYDDFIKMKSTKKQIKNIVGLHKKKKKK